MAKQYWEKCVKGKLLKKVMAEAMPENVVLIRRWGEQEARLALIAAGKAYCVARCGGCPLTEGYVAPERISTGP